MSAYIDENLHSMSAQCVSTGRHFDELNDRPRSPEPVPDKRDMIKSRIVCQYQLMFDFSERH